MSLLAWFPLNNNFYNYGALGGKLISSASFSSGKVSQYCCYFDNNPGTYNTTAFDFRQNFTFALWLKHDGPHNTGAADYIFTVGRADAEDWGYGIQTISASTIRVWFGNNLCDVSVSSNTWHHIVGAVRNTTMNVYVDGVLVNSFTPSVLPSYNLGGGLGLGCFYYNHGGILYRSKCYVNDFRIYDEALSDYEISELANGLVLHHSFNNPYEETTDNLIPYEEKFDSWSSYGFSSKGTKSVLTNGICTVTNKSGSAGITEMARWVTGPVLTKGQKVTWSCYVHGIDSTVNKSGFLHIYNSNGEVTQSDRVASFSFSSNWQRVSGQFTWNGSTNSSTSFSIYVAADNLSNNESFEFTMVQFEFRDHVTPYVQEFRDEQIVNNEAGYTNSTYTGKYKISSGAGRGSYYLQCQDYTNPIISWINPSFITNGLICWWQKDSLLHNKVLVTGISKGTGGGKYLGAGGGDSRLYSNGVGPVYYYKNAIKDPTQRYTESGVSEDEYKSILKYSTDNKWNFYCISGADLSGWSEFNINGYGQDWGLTGDIFGLKLFNLSTTDQTQIDKFVQELYNNEIALLSNQNIIINYPNEIDGLKTINVLDQQSNTTANLFSETSQNTDSTWTANDSIKIINPADNYTIMANNFKERG